MAKRHHKEKILSQNISCELSRELSCDLSGKLFCFGLGYSAQNFIRHLEQQSAGWRFSGSGRQAPAVPDPAIAHHIFNGKKPMTGAADILCDVTHMLISIAPQEAIGDPVLHHHTAEISKLRNLKWIGYLSTTGIYGDRKGDWVDEDSTPAPTSARGRQRLAAEQGWLALSDQLQVPVDIFRLGSIYGPGRGQLSNLLAGKLKKIIKPGQYFSRIHVADIAQILAAAMISANPGRCYNLVDDMPTASPVVIDYICDLLGRPHLPAINIDDAEISPMMKSFYAENKRVRNDRIKQELGITLTYPTYKEGFSELVRSLP